MLHNNLIFAPLRVIPSREQHSNFHSKKQKGRKNSFLSYSFGLTKTTFYNKYVEKTVCKSNTTHIFLPAIICSSCPKSKANNWAKCGIYSKLTTNTSGCQWSCSGVFSINLEQISHLFLVFQTLILNR